MWPMCGIAGVIGEAAADGALLARMAGRLSDRGPDDQGTWCDAEAGVGFAHRRLSIVDLSAAGHQPMVSHGGGLVLTYNGEIYNHGEIRAELDSIGATPEGGWRGYSDTETLLEAIARWGLKPALDRCVGMFAFALWDRATRRVSLVRDRFGEKPLYYGWAGRDFVFGSELKAIRYHPRFDPSIDREALGLFASRSYVPAPLSIYRGIFKLEPGCILELSGEAARRPLREPPAVGSQGGGRSLVRYWSYRDVLLAGMDDPLTDEREAVERLEAALARSVRGQAVADVPVGAFLSGGIDSSSVVALYQKYCPAPVRTFTIGFNEDAFNEADHARAVARHLGTEHHEQIVTPLEAQEVIPKLPEIYDEPFADSSQIPTYLVSRFAREQVKVSLSGDGGDELFGGYTRYFGAARLWSKIKLLPQPLRKAAAAAAGSISPGAWDRLRQLSGRRDLPPYFGAKVHKWLNTAARADRLDDIFGAFLDQWGGASPVVGAEHDSGRCAFDFDAGESAPDALRMMYCDAVSYLPDDILCKVDRASMAVSLEARVPFLDQRVAALAARMPVTMKIRGGTGKHVLREMLYREAPRQLFDRPKAGFGIPVGEWIKGPLRGWTEELLDPGRLRAEGWFDADAILQRWNEHLSDTRDSTAALWPVLMFQAWIHDQDSVSAAAA
jgi:asparagine synthase (glutamine-hydrolysing)